MSDVPGLCVLTIGDGRQEVHQKALASLTEMFPEPEYHVEVDDHDHKLGFAGAIAQGWEKVLATGAEWVWHAELDFIYHNPVPLEQMQRTMERHSKLVQMSLKRQAVNNRELLMGGIVEADPDDFQSVIEQDIWTKHQRYFTTNPSLYRASLCTLGWPREADSEGKFTHKLLDMDREIHFGIWGSKFSPPWCEHIGERVGVGY